MFNLWIIVFGFAALLLFGKVAFGLLARMATMKTLWVIGFCVMLLAVLGTIARLFQLPKGTTNDLPATIGVLIVYAGAMLFMAAWENRDVRSPPIRVRIF